MTDYLRKLLLVIIAALIIVFKVEELARHDDVIKRYNDLQEKAAIEKQQTDAKINELEKEIRILKTDSRNPGKPNIYTKIEMRKPLLIQYLLRRIRAVVVDHDIVVSEFLYVLYDFLNVFFFIESRNNHQCFHLNNYNMDIPSFLFSDVYL